MTFCANININCPSYPPSSNAQWAITKIPKKSGEPKKSSTYFSCEALGLLHLVIRRTKKILLLLLLLWSPRPSPPRHQANQKILLLLLLLWSPRPSPPRHQANQQTTKWITFYLPPPVHYNVWYGGQLFFCELQKLHYHKRQQEKIVVQAWMISSRT